MAGSAPGGNGLNMTRAWRLAPPRASFPRRGWLGLVFIAVFWPINWFWPGLRTHWAFFPLWLGYALTVDALAYRWRGTSLYARNPRAYVALFFISAPAWWLFEAFNARLGNWVYVGREFFSDAEYAFWATLSFSTVMPAVFGASEWLTGVFAGYPWARRGPRLVLGPRGLWSMFALGWLALALLLAWPRYFYPLVWAAVYLILEPVNAWLGNRTLLEHLRQGDWRPVVALTVGVWFTAFFWEMWNVFSYPKWVYHVPFVQFWHVFEMPLLGYLGYPPFALELFALYHFVAGLAGHGRTRYLIAGLLPVDER
ncbi:MAG: hypothetical protein GXO54_02270 [Chloroflexi bacterium]|nr:hypothetical protein [Chloroflexota bacterium]